MPHSNILQGHQKEVIQFVQSVELIVEFRIGMAYLLVVPKTRLELVRVIHPRDFKSLVSTIPPPGHEEK